MSFILVSLIIYALARGSCRVRVVCLLISFAFNFRLINTSISLFAGGFADSQPIATATFNRFHHPFRGCLQEVYVNSEGAERSLDFSKLEGQNIGICDLEDNFV